MPSSASDPTTVAANARHPELADYLLRHAVRHGDFTLVSGAKSSYYCDGKLVSFAPEGVFLIVEAMLQELADLDVDAVGGMDMGATPIVAAFALRSFEVERPLPTFVVRKASKEHGTMKQIEGLLPATPSRVVMVDDVVTSGGSIARAIEAVRAQGHEVVLVLSVLDREQGGAELMKKLSVPYQPLVTASELGLSAGKN